LATKAGRLSQPDASIDVPIFGKRMATWFFAATLKSALLPLS
jgi:hypothetical protein